MKFSLFSLIAIFCLVIQLNAQTPTLKSNAELFSPLDITNVQSPYRTQSGEPGADYWQNEANYKIEVALDESNKIR